MNVLEIPDAVLSPVAAILQVVKLGVVRIPLAVIQVEFLGVVLNPAAEAVVILVERLDGFGIT